MGVPTDAAESKRRLKALEETKRPDQPKGSITEAAQILGLNQSMLSRWYLLRGIKVGNDPKTTKVQCVEEFRSLAKRLGRIPARDEWKTLSPNKVSWRTHWHKYSDFIRDARIYSDNPRILLLDIETAPNIAYVWGTFKQNINPEWISANGYVLCWTAKWLGQDEVFFKRFHRGKPHDLLGPIHKLLHEAHVVVHYNGKKFDIPTLNKEFLTHGLKPPAPYKQVDCLRTMWDTFLFPSNKLDYITKTLGIGEKVRHEGPQLWIDCMADKQEAWKKMEKYNRHDVTLLESLYKRLLPWIKNHPNLAALTSDAVCPSCGSDHFRRDGAHLARLLKYEQYQCSDCGTWFRGTKTISLRLPRGEQRFQALPA